MVSDVDARVGDVTGMLLATGGGTFGIERATERWRAADPHLDRSVEATPEIRADSTRLRTLEHLTHRQQPLPAARSQRTRQTLRHHHSSRPIPRSRRLQDILAVV